MLEGHRLAVEVLTALLSERCIVSYREKEVFGVVHVVFCAFSEVHGSNNKSFAVFVRVEIKLGCLLLVIDLGYYEGLVAQVAQLRAENNCFRLTERAVEFAVAFKVFTCVDLSVLFERVLVVKVLKCKLAGHHGHYSFLGTAFVFVVNTSVNGIALAAGDDLPGE